MDFKKPHDLKKFFKSYQFWNGVLFYVIWYLCVLGASFHFERSAVSISILLIGLHFYISKIKLLDLFFLVSFVCLGFCVDLIFLHFHIHFYPENAFSWRLFGVPLWILMLYAGFSTTINHCLSFIKTYPWLSGLFGGIGSAICYWFESFRGIITFPYGLFSLLCIGAYWGLLMVLSKPLHGLFSKRFDQD
jgi:hypothetical protein